MHYPFLGFGLGIRTHYYDELLNKKPLDVDWGEAITENYMALSNGEYGRSIQKLEKIRSHMPVVLHGVSLSLGSAEPLDFSYLKRWKDLINRIEPAWVSDHLCWTSTGGHNTHDLLPFPFNREIVNHVSEKILRAQDYIGRKMLIENVSAYIEYKNSEMTEYEFLIEIVKKTGCGILLDVNNIFVNSFNQGFDPLEYLYAIPKSAVGQIHLAGHINEKNFKIDTHDMPVCKEVWGLYRKAAKHFGKVSVMIERDDNFPDWKDLTAELKKAKKIWIEENERRTSQITASL